MFWLDLCTKSKPKKLKSTFIHEETLAPPTGGPAGAAVQIVLAALVMRDPAFVRAAPSQLV